MTAVREPERLRLFVALELSQKAVEALVAWRRPVLRDEPGWRAVPAENLHLTLCFLGSLAAGQTGAIAAATLAAAGAGQLSGAAALQEPVLLPRRRPRVLAVSVTDPEGSLAELQARISAALVGGGWYRPEARAFLPHVTVARARDREPVRTRGEQLPALAPVGIGSCAVTLFRSRLAPGGSRYEPLARAPARR